ALLWGILELQKKIKAYKEGKEFKEIPVKQAAPSFPIKK
ncbi:MAG TPA: NADH-quinone oxidoreductase subunit B, partial [Hydrogenothermaceae bacterium]|nr:NADH-quinone oxidoreductase subunit B [Hydrogenothermaceae bacterium]